MHSPHRGAAPWQAFIAAICSLLLVVASGCRGGPGSQPDAGRLQLPLTGVSSSGNVYRLRGGIFAIVGMETGHEAVVSTEDDPDETRIEVDLPSDFYLVTLEPGYYLERVDSEMSEPLASAQATKESHLAARGVKTRALPVGAAGAEPIPAPEEPPGAGGAGPGTVPVAGAPNSGGTGSFEPLEAILISENPVSVFIEPYETSVVVFRFRVGDEIVVTNPGALAIEIEVEEQAACEDDAFEPNDSQAQATDIATDTPFEAVACEEDDDWYAFEPPAAEGEQFGIIISFVHAQGDIDAVLFDADGFPTSIGAGVTDQELLVGTSDGRGYNLLVYTLSTTNSYQVEFVSDTSQFLSDCCAPSPLPTCLNQTVSDCVCEMDPFCCDIAFDESCAYEAITQCGAECLGPGDCCEATSEAGCSDPEVNACICGVDPLCCVQSYDELCITEAQAECSLACEMPPPSSDCCTVSESPSCTDPYVQQCVCDLDPICCTGPYDENCASLAASSCGAECSPPPSGSCCTPSAGPGCEDTEVEACVCETDPFCCVEEFDALCVEMATGACGAACEEDSP